MSKINEYLKDISDEYHERRADFIEKPLENYKGKNPFRTVGIQCSGICGMIVETIIDPIPKKWKENY